MDVTPLASAFWDQISQPKPDAVIAEAKRKILLDTAAPSFTVKGRRKDEMILSATAAQSSAD